MSDVLRLCAILLSLAGAASALDLFGKVVNLDGSGRGGVTVSLAGTSLSTVTAGDGAWSISDGTGVQVRSTRVGQPTGHLLIQDGRLRVVLAGRDPSGRILTESPSRAGRTSASAARALGDAPDTLVYSWNGGVFLRDTVSADRSGMVRAFDTTWNAKIVYGYLTDARDGRTYRTVKIGSQTWMAENLNYAGAGVCYNNSADSCSKYGRLYKWVELMQDTASSKASPSGVKEICPTGWHVPSDGEWQSLEVVVGMNVTDAANEGFRGTTQGTEFKSMLGWSSDTGSDAYGFRVLPAGYFDVVGVFCNVGSSSSFWTASEYNASNAWYRSFGNGYARVGRFNTEETKGASLRCLQM